MFDFTFIVYIFQLYCLPLWQIKRFVLLRATDAIVPVLPLEPLPAMIRCTMHRTGIDRISYYQTP